MSSTQAVSWYAVLVLFVTAASWLCASPRAQNPVSVAEQISVAGPLEQRARPVTVQNPVPRLTRAMMPQNPVPAPPIIVALRVTLDERSGG